MIGNIAGTCMMAGLMLGTSVAADAQRYFARQKLTNSAQGTPTGPKAAVCNGIGPRTYLTSRESGQNSEGFFASRSEAIQTCQTKATIFYNDPGVDPSRHFYGCQLIVNEGRLQLLTTGGHLTSKVLYTDMAPMWEVAEAVPCTAG